MELSNLLEARRQCIEELAALPGWVLGSLVQTEREQAGRKKPFRYLSRSVHGKNRITYVAEHQVRRVREALEAGRVAKDLLGRISDLTMAIIKAQNDLQDAEDVQDAEQ